jgi:hypothetical protein
MTGLIEHWFIEAILIISGSVLVTVMIAWLYNQFNKDI